VIFTGCGTESNNLAILGVLADKPAKRHVIISAVEHPSILNLCGKLCDSIEITMLPVDSNGLIDPNDVRRSLRDDTAMVSVMTANNETGVLSPIEEIGAICRDRGIVFHTDAAQAVGKVSVDVDAMKVDLLTITGHKFHAPKGIGALYVRMLTPLDPTFMVGGGQEQGLRSGTENVPYIVALGQAAQLAAAHLHTMQSDVRKLRDRLECGLTESIKGSSVNGHRDRRLPNTINISFQGVRASRLVSALGKAGICVSPGAACHAGEDRPSPVLTAMGIDEELATGAVRLSLSRYTTDAEIDSALETIPKVVQSLL
jgi:cysteine desulfurase